MTYVLELAAHADLPVQTVLRVLLRQPSSEDAQRRVAAAVAEIGLPDYPRPDGHVEVLPAVAGQVEAASELELDPADEVRGMLRALVAGLQRERRERVDDFSLSTDLFIEGWQSVDRRLGRLEKMIERIDQRQQFERSRRGAEVHRLDDHRTSGL